MQTNTPQHPQTKPNVGGEGGEGREMKKPTNQNTNTQNTPPQKSLFLFFSNRAFYFY